MSNNELKYPVLLERPLNYFAIKPNLVREIFERALEALKRMHAYTRNDPGCCGQFHVRTHALESRSGFHSQALTY